MTTPEYIAAASAILALVGGPPAIRAVAEWIAKRRERREALEEQRERHRHEEELAEIRADEITGKHHIDTVAGLAKVVHEQSTEILMLRAAARDHDKHCDEKIAAAIRSMRTPGFRLPRPGGEEE